MGLTIDLTVPRALRVLKFLLTALELYASLKQSPVASVAIIVLTIVIACLETRSKD